MNNTRTTARTKLVPTRSKPHPLTEGDITPCKGVYTHPYGTSTSSSTKAISPLVFPGIRPEKQKALSAYKIISVVAKVFGVDASAITTRTRKHPVCEVRQVCMMIMRLRLKISFQGIGDVFGLDHSSVIHGIAAVKDRIHVYPDFRTKVETAKNKLTYGN